MKFDINSDKLRIAAWHGVLFIAINDEDIEKKAVVFGKRYVEASKLHAIVTGYEIDNYPKMCVMKEAECITEYLSKNSLGRHITVWSDDKELKASFIKVLLQHGWLGSIQISDKAITNWSLMNTIKDYNKGLSTTDDEVVPLASMTVEYTFDTISARYDKETGQMYMDHMSNKNGCVSRDKLEGLFCLVK